VIRGSIRNMTFMDRTANIEQRSSSYPISPSF